MRKLPFLCSLIAPAAWAAVPPAPAGDADLGGQLVQTAGGLIVVLGVLLGLAWLVKRYLGTPGIGGKSRVQVLGGVSLGPRERAVIVEVEGERLLLGVAQGNVRLLHVLCKADQDFATQLREAEEETA